MPKLYKIDRSILRPEIRKRFSESVDVVGDIDYERLMADFNKIKAEMSGESGFLLFAVDEKGHSIYLNSLTPEYSASILLEKDDVDMTDEDYNLYYDLCDEREEEIAEKIAEQYETDEEEFAFGLGGLDGVNWDYIVKHYLKEDVCKKFGGKFNRETKECLFEWEL